jgi:hypothetical protein
MIKLKFLFLKTFSFVLLISLFVGCDESSIEIPEYRIAKVTNVQKEDSRIELAYKESSVSNISLYSKNVLLSTTGVNYHLNGLTCELEGVTYSVQWDAVIGPPRARIVEAYIGKALTHSVEYFYDDAGRILRALIQASELGVPVWCNYAYYDDYIIVDDAGVPHRIDLSDEENTGYVCNVIDFAAEANVTSTYVINPDLYYLNIYGVPVNKLPSGYEILRSGDTLTKVGAYSYGY